MNGFYNPNNFFWRGFGRIADFFILSVFWMVCCVPIVTLFPACIALYDSTAHCVLGNEQHPYSRFFRTFRNELKRGVGLTLLWCAIGAVAVLGYQLLGQLVPEAQRMTVSSIYLACAAIPLCVVIWLIPVQSRYVYTFGALHSTAAALALRHLPTTVILLIISLVGSYVLYLLPFLICFLPGIMVYLQSWFIERVFRQYTQDADPQPEAA